jgi:sortase (surface protein transpeptidase)
MLSAPRAENRILPGLLPTGQRKYSEAGAPLSVGRYPSGQTRGADQVMRRGPRGFRLIFGVVALLVLTTVATGYLAHRTGLSRENQSDRGHRSAASPTARAQDNSSSGPSLLVASIHLDHPLTPEGLHGGEINPDAGQVIWFTGNGRVAPGQEGVSVVAGHVADGSGPDVFADLSKIKIGDPVVTVGKNGDRTVYTASRAYTVSKVELQSDSTVWGGVDHGKRLILVTCDDALGFRADGHRAANYVVVANAA